ncbi:EF-hand, partial [Aureobasidium melanogenum]
MDVEWEEGIWKLTSVAKLGGVAACACNGKARTGEEVLYGCVHVLKDMCLNGDCKLTATYSLHCPYKRCKRKWKVIEETRQRQQDITKDVKMQPTKTQHRIQTKTKKMDQANTTNYKEAFALFDKRGTGRVQLESLGDLLRACGQNPTLAEISDLEKSIGGDFDFDSFSKVLNRAGGFRDPGEPEEYCRGFQVFDKDMTGFIGVGQLRYILTNLGEKMSDDEVDELLKAVDTSSGEINYVDLVKTVLAN